MRIAILTNDFPPHLKGGAGRIASLQAEWFKAHGYDVRVYRKGRENCPDQSVGTREKGKVSLRRLFSLLSSLFSHLRDLFPNHQTVQDIVAWKPDVLISHNLTGCGWGTARKVRRRIPCRWIHLLHDVQLFEPSGQICAGESFARLRKIWRRIWAFLRKRFFGIPDLVVSPSRWLLDQHRQFGFFKQIKTVVIPNPIATGRGNHSLRSLGKRESIGDAPSETSLRSHLLSSLRRPSAAVGEGGFPLPSSLFPPAALRSRRRRGLPSVVYVGRLARDKGVHVLLEAWKRLQDDSRKLVLIGDGPLRKECEAMADQCVVTLGSLSHEDVLEQLKQASLLVLPSLVMENQPTVLLEAIAFNIPAVATNVGGVRELLDGYGAVIPPGDDSALIYAIQHPPIVSAKIRERILKRHQTDAVMQKWTELF